MKVGFIGVGNMGGPMCRNIIRNTNHEVIVFDLSPDAVKACTDLGASSATSVADVAARCDVVITSLPIPRVVEDVTLGQGGLDDRPAQHAVASGDGDYAVGHGGLPIGGRASIGPGNGSA